VKLTRRCHKEEGEECGPGGKEKKKMGIPLRKRELSLVNSKKKYPGVRRVGDVSFEGGGTAESFGNADHKRPNGGRLRGIEEQVTWMNEFDVGANKEGFRGGRKDHSSVLRGKGFA